MARKTTRRDFIKTGAVIGAAGFWTSRSAPLWSAPKSANDKLNIGIIGAGGKGYSDMRAVSSENIIALCDPDEKRSAKARKENPQANKYHDFRVMLEKEKTLDAVTVSTPDHNHAPAAVMAMRMGLHVFVQKPLTWSVTEARVMKQVAREMKVATQMGNQGTSTSGLRRGAEVIQAGAIGAVHETHVWTNRPVWPQGINTKRPKGYKTPPASLKWDVWLGPAKWRPYNDGYLPFDWRGWWDFGTGPLGDMACHTANLAFMALNLTVPTKVEVVRAEGLNPETAPDSTTLLLHYPAHDGRPPVKFYWYDGGNLPPKDITEGLKLPNSGSLLVGEKGKLFSPNDYGSSWELHPKKDFEGYEGPKETIPRSPGHAKEWLIACKGGPKAMSNFDYSALLTESILLGNVATRSAGTIEYDVENMKITNNPDANQYLHRHYRQGYTL